MRNILIAVALIALAISAYMYQQTFSNNKPIKHISKLAALDYVPADTIVFSGQLTPFPIKQYLKHFTYDKAAQNQLDELLKHLNANENPEPAQVFFTSLIQTYSDATKSPEQLSQTYGIGDEVRALFYTVGLLPVLKYEIKSPGAFWQMLETAEVASGIVTEEHKSNNIAYKTYEIYHENDFKLELVATINHGWATLTFNSPLNDQTMLEQALAITKPLKNLSDENTLHDIANKHDFDGSYLGFINHIAIINGLTGKDSNQFNQMLMSMTEMSDEHPLSIIQTPACQQDLSEIVNDWPRTAFGLHDIAITDEAINMSAAMIIESNNLDIMKVLSSIRGFLPEHLNDANNKIMSIGLGIDVAKVTPFLKTIWDNLTQTTYTCQPLIELQKEIAKNNPIMSAMVTGMANGVKGVSFSLLDLQFSNENDKPELKKLDALFTLSANHPGSIFNSIKAFHPPLKDLKLAKDGTPVNLEKYFPLPTELGPAPDIAIKGNHLVLYRGNKAKLIADNIAEQELVNNGFNSLSIDYQAFFTPFLEAAEFSGQQLPEQLQTLKDYNMKMHFSMDFTDKGIEFTSKMDNKK